MYCSSCGIDSVEGLKYCKRCGASLTASESVPGRRPVALIALLIIAIASIAVLGLSLPLTMARELISIGFRTKEIIILFFGSGFFTVMITKLITQVLLKIVESQKHDHAKLTHARGVPYEPQQIGQPSPIGSVTENTTRSFDQRRFDDARL
jgi:uncharacterized paraquat-inducible protein A